MTVKPKTAMRRVVPAVFAIAAGYVDAACLSPVGATPVGSDSLPAEQRPASPGGNWVFHVDQPSIDNEVEFVEVDTLVSSARTWVFHSLSTRAWSGALVAPFSSGDGVGWQLGDGRVFWSFTTSAGDPAQMTWHLLGDTIRGRVTFPTTPGDSGYTLVGVRCGVSPKAARATLLPGSASKLPVILLRLDDLPTSDTAVVPRLIERGVYGELAIPTALMPAQDHATWADVNRWVLAGFGVAAHSRHHTEIVSDQGFMDEVVGAIGDLAARGYPTRDFVQPGTWTGATNFDSLAKLQTWRGALMQTFADVFEAYVYQNPVPLPLTDSTALGLSHMTISDGATPAEILSWWHRASQSSGLTVFLIHSARMSSPDALDWFFDSVAVAQRAGRIQLAHTASDAPAH